MQEDPLNKCQKQFLKPNGMFFDKNPQSFCSKPKKNSKSIIFLQKTNFPRKFLLYKLTAVLTNFLKPLASLLQNIFLTAQKQKETQKTRRKTVHSKIYSGHKECSFDEPVENTTHISEHILLEKQKKLNNSKSF